MPIRTLTQVVLVLTVVTMEMVRTEPLRPMLTVSVPTVLLLVNTSVGLATPVAILTRTMCSSVWPRQAATETGLLPVVTTTENPLVTLVHGDVSTELAVGLVMHSVNVPATALVASTSVEQGHTVTQIAIATSVHTAKERTVLQLVRISVHTVVMMLAHKLIVSVPAIVPSTSTIVLAMMSTSAHTLRLPTVVVHEL